MADFSPTGLRVLVEIAQAGSFTAAARALGLHAVGGLAAGRGAGGGGGRRAVRTPPRRRRADARRAPGCCAAPSGCWTSSTRPRATWPTPNASGPVRLGAFATAVAGLVPAALATLPPDLVVTLREGTTPTLTRALRAGHPRPGRARADPALPAAGRRVAAARAHGSGRARAAGGRRAAAPVRGPPRGRGGQLAGQVWVAGRSDAGDAARRVARRSPSARTSATSCATGWPSCSSSPRAWRSPRSPPVALDALPDGVHAVAVRGEPQEARRLVLARLPGPLSGAAAAVAEALATPGDRAHTQAWPSSS